MPRESTPRNRKFHIQVLVFGQPLTSSSFGHSLSHVRFEQSFVFDMMSSEEIIAQYLKENASLKLSLLSEDIVQGSCKQYIESLQVNKEVQLNCIMDGFNSQTQEKNGSYPSIELSLALHTLDTHGNNISAESMFRRGTEVDEHQSANSSDTHLKTPDKTKRTELIDLTCDEGKDKIEETSKPNPATQIQENGLEQSENRDVNSNTTVEVKETQDIIEVLTITESQNITESPESVIPQTEVQPPKQKPVQDERTVNTAQNSARSLPCKEPGLKLNLIDLKFSDNHGMLTVICFFKVIFLNYFYF